MNLETPKTAINLKKPKQKMEPVNTTGYFAKPKVEFTKQYGSVTVRQFPHKVRPGAVMLNAFPTSTFTSILAAGYIRENMKLPLIGSISSSKFPARCLVEDGMPIHPVRIYGEQDLVVVLAELKVPTELEGEVAMCLLELAERLQCRLIMNIEGLPMEDHQRKPLNFLSNDEEFAVCFRDMGAVPLKDCVVAGLAGLILAESAYSPTVGTALVCAPCDPHYPDAQSSVAVVKALARFLRIDIDSKPLAAKAEALETGVSKFMAQQRSNTTSNDFMYV